MHSLGQLLGFIWRSTRRIAVLVIGVALVAVGLVMLVTPGPGIVLVIAGLAVLATEFVWAERMLDKAKTRATATASRVPGADRVKSAAQRIRRRSD